MAASSPTLSNNTAVAANTTATTIASTKTTMFSAASAANPLFRTDTPPKTQRGLNKPKCKQCGNVARSRCPFESCKSCCARNQNPCHIHVLKGSTIVPDKPPNSSNAPPEQLPNEASSSMTSSRFATLRQLSSNFAQFNNVHIPLRSRKPPTRKDAAAINEWRFSKLKESKEIYSEMENEAFDRYMQNVNLLEEVLTGKSTEGDVLSASESTSNSSEKDTEMIISKLKFHLRSNLIKNDSFRRRMQQIVDHGVKKLKSCELNDSEEVVNSEKELLNGVKKANNRRTERAIAISGLIDKLNKARNEEDLCTCLEAKVQIFDKNVHLSQTEAKGGTELKNKSLQSTSETGKSLNYTLPRLVGTTEIDPESLNTIDKHFSSLENIEHL